MDLCPRGDLNPEIGEISLITGLNSKTGEESPDRGVHAHHCTPDERAAARSLSSLLGHHSLEEMVRIVLDRNKRLPLFVA